MIDQNKETEIGVLEALLDAEPLNQNEIVTAMGKEIKNSTSRVRVSRAISKLEKYLKRVPNNIDKSGKRWQFKQDINTIKRVAKEYPQLISLLQENGYGIEILDSFLGEKWWDGYGDKDDYITLVNRIGLSKGLFEYCLEHDFESVKTLWAESLCLTQWWASQVDRRRRFKNNNKVPDKYLIMDYIADYFLYDDIIKGQSNEEEKQYLEKRNKEIFEGHKAMVKLDQRLASEPLSVIDSETLGSEIDIL